MPSRIALAVVLLLAWRGALAQSADAAMQNLLTALSEGREAVLYTPLANGMLQVTRFRAPIAVPRPQAEAAVAIARQHLSMLDIEYPSADQLARALVGGTIDTRDGPQTLPGVLPLTGNPPQITTELVANTLPQPPSAATGGTGPLYPRQ